MQNPALRLLTFAIVFMPLQATAQQAQQPNTLPPYYGFGPSHMWGYGGGWMFGTMMLFFLAMCVAMFLFARGSSGHHMHGRHRYLLDDGDANRSALQILNERFARGEVEKEEYAEKKAALLSKS
jgi:putative membrane protein